jgi:cysteinyl-tRNA synthetase
LDKFYNALLRVKDVKTAEVAPDERVVNALADDINTPLAISYLHDIANNLNKAETVEDKQHYKSLLLASADVMGLLYQNAEDWFKGSASEDGISEDEINQLIAERLAAKKSKDWAKADAIRNQLKDAGIVLEDTPQGTSWKRA